MQTRWFKGLSDQQSTDLRAQLVAADKALDRLIEILEADLKAIQEIQCSKEAYESPSWAYLQADSIGQQRAYRKTLRLISKDSTK